MSSPTSAVRVFRFLAVCAILHAFLLSLWVVLSWPLFPWNSEWASGLRAPHLWVGFATLWVFWPIVLTLHAGRSFTRALIALAVSAIILFPSFREYDSLAPRVFGLPEGVYSLSPLVMWDYFSGYRAGRAEAQSDLRSGRLVHEEIGMPRPPDYYQVVHQRHQIELRTYGDIVTEKIIGHAKGYNEIADPEIKRRFGSDVLGPASDEAFKHWNEAQAKQNP